MTDEIFFDGIRYISASEAAREAGLTRDYVARLCRENKIRGKQVGKNWYASKEALGSFLLKQGHEHITRNEELARKRAEEYRSAFQENILPKNQTIADTAIASVENLQPPNNLVAEVPLPLTSPQLTRAISFASHMANGPTGAVDAAYRLVPHATIALVSPVMEFAHKLFAVVVATMLTFGTYALVDTERARLVSGMIRNGSLALMNSGELINSLALNAKEQVAAVGSNPTEYISRGLAKLSRAVNRNVDELIYSAAFPESLVQSQSLADSSRLALSNERASVNVRIDSYGSTQLTTSRPLSGTSTSRKNAVAENENDTTPASRATVINQPIVERVIETQRLLSVGGISEDILNQRIQQLDNKLTSQMYSLTSAQSTQSAQIYQVISQTNRINQLTSVAISNATITDSSFAGSSISAATLSVSGNASFGNATSTTIFSTNASTTNATSTNLFSVLGHFTTGIIDALTSTLATITNLTATNIVATNATTTNATTTNFYASTLGAVTASTTNLTFATAIGGSATTTNLFSTTASSTNLFSQAANFGTLGAGATTLSSTLNVTGLTTLGNLSLTAGTTTSFFSTTASSTNLFSQSAALGALTANTLTLNSTLTSTGLATFTNGFLSLASSTITNGLFTISGGASTTNLTASGTGYFGTATTTNLFATTASFGSLSLTTALPITSGGTGATSLNNLITLGDHTTGNYVATLANAGGLTIANSGSETAAVTAALNLGNANSWTALQSFANASSTLFSNFGTAYFGGSATSSFSSTGALTLATPLAVTSGGTGVTATSSLGIALSDTTGTLAVARGGTNLTSYTVNQLLYASGTGTIGQIATSSLGLLTTNVAEGSNLYYTDARSRAAISASSPLSYNSGTGALSFLFNTANTWTGLNQFGNASTSLFSSYGPSYFGGTATSTFNSAGALTLASALGVGSGGTGQSTVTTGDILYGSGTNTWGKLGIGTGG
ncbi:MAG: hypothetical protein AAB830_00715, partial [Patescibacteria group bacterium]